jgi:hypothetical protein
VSNLDEPEAEGEETSLYTVEAHGIPVVVTTADDIQEVEASFDTWLGQDLLVLEHNGKPLWNGDKENLQVREANPQEAATWRASSQRAIEDGEDESEESHLAFLVDVTEPD